MDAALYPPQHGYYRSRREKMGREGDYLTSPEVSPIFGVLLGRHLREMWQAMGEPRRFDGGEAGAVRWSADLPDAIEGCLLSNEPLDSFPVHRVSVREGALLEVFVGWDGARFVEELRPPSTPELESYFHSLGLLPGEGCLAEVNLAALVWMRRAGRALRSGFLLTLDYGYEAHELYAPWRKDGTILCFYRHNAAGDPYARLGRQDITSHVDFTSLRQAGGESGLRTLGLGSPRGVLTELGIAEAVAPPGEGDANLEEYYE